MTFEIRWIMVWIMAVACWSGDGAFAQDKPHIIKPNVVIQWGHSSPDTAYARRHAEWLERRPFDGVVMTIDPRDADFVEPSFWHGQIDWARNRGLEYLAQMYERPREKGSLSWGGGVGMTAQASTGPWNPNNKYTDETLAKALADLQATKFSRFRFNLIETFVMGPTNDWFDDEQWAQRCRNFAAVARFARHAGLKGILFDDEQYGQGGAWPEAVRGGRSFDEISAKARLRGREFAQAMCREFPDMVFWTLHGYSSIAANVEVGYPDIARTTKLPFFDGILEGSSKDFVFVDGGENSYGFNTREHFLWGRKLCREEPIRMGLTQVPELHREKVRVGFGIWPDYYGRVNPDNPENSYFGPGRWQRAVNNALEFGDGYVWVYGEGWTWWVEGSDDRAPVDIFQGKRGFPLAYWHATEAARKSPGSDTSEMPPYSGLPQNGRHFCIDGENVRGLLEKTDKVYELPMEGWTFKLDDFGVDSDDPKTFDKPIKIGETWEKQGFAGMDTFGWYRLEFKLPENLIGRRLHFYFPDVSGSVWMSSRACPRPQGVAHRFIGLDPQANRKPFALGGEKLGSSRNQMSSYFFEPGKPAVLVLKVQGHQGVGGILAPIEVLTEK